MSIDFEKSFSDFLDDNKYDETQNALFKITREAFKAGWNAAQITNKSNTKILEIKQPNRD